MTRYLIAVLLILGGCGPLRSPVILERAEIAKCGSAGLYVDVMSGGRLYGLHFGSRGVYCESWEKSKYWRIVYKPAGWESYDELIEAREVRP